MNLIKCVHKRREMDGGEGTPWRRGFFIARPESRRRGNPMSYRRGTGQIAVTETIRDKSASALARPAVIARL